MESTQGAGERKLKRTFLKQGLTGCLAIATLALVSPGSNADVICDPQDHCLSETDSAIYLEAENNMKLANWHVALDLFGELYALELRDGTKDNFLLANNYAVALGKTGEPELAAQVLERYFKNLGGIGAGFENLMSAYEHLAMLDEAKHGRLGLDLQFVSATLKRRSEPRFANNPGSNAVTAGIETPDSLDGSSKEISERLDAFLSAWSAGNIDNYLAFYAPRQSPAQGVSYENWLQQRMERVTTDRLISLQSSDLTVSRGDDGKVVTQYQQIYRSCDYEDNIRKSLTWVRMDGTWRIENERSL